MFLTATAKRPLTWELVSDRFPTTKSCFRLKSIVNVQCYAPTVSFDIAGKDTSYEQLNALRGTFHKGDIVMVTGEPYSDM